MHRLRTERQLSLSVTPIYKAPRITLSACFLNARSLHKHIKDVRKDKDYLSTVDVNMFSETTLTQIDDSCNLFLIENNS